MTKRRKRKQKREREGEKEREKIRHTIAFLSVNSNISLIRFKKKMNGAIYKTIKKKEDFPLCKPLSIERRAFSIQNHHLFIWVALSVLFSFRSLFLSDFFTATRCLFELSHGTFLAISSLTLKTPFSIITLRTYQSVNHSSMWGGGGGMRGYSYRNIPSQ